MEGEPKLAGTLEGRSVVAVRAATGADEDGIQRGDYLLVHPDPAVGDGSTVVAVVDGQPSVRRLIRGAAGERHLLPVSPYALPLALPAERARILGPLVGVLRHRRDCKATKPSRPASDAPSDPALRMMGDALDTALVRATPGRKGVRVREISRELRALCDCYVGTSVPRLRRALLREAQSRVAALRRVLALEEAQGA